MELFISNISIGDWMPGEQEYEARIKKILVNLSNTPLTLTPNYYVQPWQSKKVEEKQKTKGQNILALDIKTALGSERIKKNWTQHIDNFLGPITLWKSESIHLGLTNSAPLPLICPFKLQVNLWFALAGTSCLVHQEHSFIETHVQVKGKGWMQKYRAKKSKEPYESIKLEMGDCHPVFATQISEYEIKYPWHQYYAETDAIWLAIEWHPQLR